MFTVTFKRPIKSTEKTREKTREKIIQLILKNSTITTAELAKEIGISKKGIEFQLQKLKSEKRIERIGPDKGGYRHVTHKG